MYWNIKERNLRWYAPTGTAPIYCRCKSQSYDSKQHQRGLMWSCVKFVAVMRSWRRTARINIQPAAVNLSSLFCPCVQVPVPIGRRVSGFAWTPTWSSAGGETQVQRRASKHSPDCAALDLITIKVTRTQARNFIFQKGCLSCLTPVTHMSN